MARISVLGVAMAPAASVGPSIPSVPANSAATRSFAPSFELEGGGGRACV